MVDNVTIPASGTGTATPVVATDDIAGVHYQKVKLFDGTADSTVAVGAVDETGASAVDALAVGGGTPNDSVDSGNPVKIGGRGQGSAPTAVADGDRVNAWFTDNGALATVVTNLTGSAVATVASPTDALAGTGSLGTRPFTQIYNGTDWDRIRSTAALTAAPNVETGITAVGRGPGYDRKRDPAGVAATSTSNAVTVVVDGSDMIIFHVTTIGTTPGSMIFETTNDDSAWATAQFVVKVSTGPDLRVEGSFVPAVNDIYMVRTAGIRQVRYRVNAVYASGTATVKVTSTAGVGVVKALDLVGAPHNVGYALASATAQYTGTQTSTTLGPTVASTQRLVVTYIQIQAGGTTAGALQVYFGTGAYVRGTNKAIFDGEFAPSATLKPGFTSAPSVPFEGAADEELKVTDSAAINPLTITIWYYLIAA